MKRISILIGMLALLSACSSVDTKPIDTKDFRTWSQTPPMGWNSWDCYGPTVVEDEVKANADYMAENLLEYGWEYVVVDIRWFVSNDKAGGYNEVDPQYNLDEYGRYTPAVNRFPSAADGQGFKPLADYVHSKGLKFGIHIMRGIPKEAVKAQTPVLGADGITADMIYSEDHLCQWLHDNYTVDSSKKGAQEYYNSIFDLYASWGVDFIKIDDLSAPYYHEDEIDMIRTAIDRTGRQIVLSTSPGETPLEAADHVSTHANMWRMVNDVWDKWGDVTHIFNVAQGWYPYIGDGTWPDCDMLPLGRISIRGERGHDRSTRLTPDEQRSMMTFWCIFRSPLMFGGDLPSLDEATKSLITNREVLEAHQKGSNVRQVLQDENHLVVASDNGKLHYLAVFNKSEETQEFSVPLEKLGLKKAKAKDLWTGEESKLRDNVVVTLDPHACVLLSLK